MNHLIAPSILSADFANLGRDIEMINNSEADWVHFDVMDGRFVQNISFGIPILKAVKPLSTKPLDVHLMIVEPDRYIDLFHNAGADHLTIHPEACHHVHMAVQNIKKLGMKAGLAINPHTPVSSLEDIIADVDIVCLMSVNPGWGGQKFIRQTLHKIEKLRKLIEASGSNAVIEIDGGVTLDNAPEILRAGADVLVAGSTVFKAADPLKTISTLKSVDPHTINV